MRLREPRNEEVEVVVAIVVIGELREFGRPVAPAAETRAVTTVVGAALGRQRAAALAAAGVERRVDHDRIERARGQQRQYHRVVGVHDEVIG